ncbi:hypothetical protein DEH12_16780 [Vibrio cholerae]|nr:hypothetical protein [Vibrio cholerae]
MDHFGSAQALRDLRFVRDLARALTAHRKPENFRNTAGLAPVVKFQRSRVPGLSAEPDSNHAADIAAKRLYLKVLPVLLGALNTRFSPCLIAKAIGFRTIKFFMLFIPL